MNRTKNQLRETNHKRCSSERSEILVRVSVKNKQENTVC